jgi:secreted Zn-dependent insulinase-like peptidase
MYSNVPKLFTDKQNLKIYYKLDRSYLVPRINIYLNVISPFLRTNPEEYFVLQIFLNYLNTNFESTFADLKDTGGEIDITFNENGYVINLNIFSDLMPKVMEKLISLIFNPILDDSLFKQLSQLSLEEIKTHAETQPYIKAKEIFMKIIKERVSSNMDLANNKAIFNMTYDKFNQTLSQIVKSLSINSLFYGYVKMDDLENISKNLEQNLKINAIAINNSKMKQSPSVNEMVNFLNSHKSITQPVIYQIKNDLKSERNHLVMNFYQVGPRDYRRSLMLNLIEMIWGNMFYYYLRTQKQLGYVVTSNKEFLDNYMYFTFIVQGNKEDPSMMNLEIDKVINKLSEKVNSLEEGKLKEMINSIKSELQKRDTNLKERTFRVWNEVLHNSQDFNRKENLEKEISKITKKDIVDTFNSVFIDEPQKLSIQIYSGNSEITEREELYYLNSNIKYYVTSNINVLNDLQEQYHKIEDDI